jgi:hypothetical protein
VNAVDLGGIVFQNGTVNTTRTRPITRFIAQPDSWIELFNYKNL